MDYEEARKMLKKSEFTSDVRSDTDENGPRKNRVNAHHALSSSDAEDFTECIYVSPVRCPRSPKSFFSSQKSGPNDSMSSLEKMHFSGRHSVKRPAHLDPSCRSSYLPATSSPARSSTSFGNVSVSQLVTYPEFAAFQEVVFQKFAESKEIEPENNMLLKRLLYTKGRPATTQEMPLDMPHLPLASVSDVSQLETWLSKDVNKPCLVNYLSAVGGKDVQDTTRNIMCKVFGEHVATQYNWAGRRGKNPFSVLNLKNVVFAQ